MSNSPAAPFARPASSLPEGVDGPAGLARLLAKAGYFADDGVATAAYLALALPRPLLVEGEAGVGKTALAHALARVLGADLLRLQCYEGIDASQALYDWDFPRQLLHLRAAESAGTASGSADAERLEAEVYSRRFLLARPLLAALETTPSVLLVDEVDRADDEFEAFLLEVLSEYTVTVPELGTIRAEVPPVVVVTSNRTREVHDALKRRCLYHWVEHPEFDREVAIVRARVPDASEELASQVARTVAALRAQDLQPDGGFPGGRTAPSEAFPDGRVLRATTGCHDITAYPSKGIAAGACSGQGVLLDISDPLAPVVTSSVTDENFTFWHSATFNNEASKVVFTDELGGGGAPTCNPTVGDELGADAIYDIVDGQLVKRSYFKISRTQTNEENCVAHNGSLIPNTQGRDIMVQSWYQGGISVFDFTDSANPVELAFFDRGPISDTSRVLGGSWSAYWYDGKIYSSDIQQGFDVLKLNDSAIAGSGSDRTRTVNPQSQTPYTVGASGRSM